MVLDFYGVFLYSVHISTESMNDSNKKARMRFVQIARMGEVVFHAKDLANLWGIVKKNTLYTTLARYTQQGLLFRIQNGLYSIKPPEKVDPLLLGLKALHAYAYISTETILVRGGVIAQIIPEITLVSGVSKRFSLAGNYYFSRKLSSRFLYNPAGVSTGDNGVRKASVERAVADLLYFNPRAHIDAGRSKLVDWKRVAEIQQSVGYPPMTILSSIKTNKKS